PIVKVAVEDLARKPGKLTVTPVVSDPLFPAGTVTLDPDGKKLRLAPKEGLTGTATVTLIAQTDDGREARRSFKVTVAPKPPPPLREGGKATVVLVGADVTTAIYAEATGSGKQLGVEGLAKGTVVLVEKIKGNRCFVTWTEGGEKYDGWVEQ